MSFDIFNPLIQNYPEFFDYLIVYPVSLVFIAFVVPTVLTMSFQPVESLLFFVEEGEGNSSPVF
jgi:hypothetical protein